MRILTNRNFKNNKDVEYIEKNEYGFMWKGSEFHITNLHRVELADGEWTYGYSWEETQFGFPVDEDFVKDKFTECGREYKP